MTTPRKGSELEAEAEWPARRTFGLARGWPTASTSEFPRVASRNQPRGVPRSLSSAGHQDLAVPRRRPSSIRTPISSRLRLGKPQLPLRPDGRQARNV